MDEADFSSILQMYPNGSGDGSYFVEFLHEQTARHYAELAAASPAGPFPQVWGPDAPTCQVSEAFPMSPGLVQPKPSSMPIPFQQRRSQTAYAATPASQPAPAPVQTGHAVEIWGLPGNLMSQKMVEAILDQAGLDNTAVNFAFFPPDKAEISFKNSHSADLCAAHFEGRKWNPQGPVVKARRKEASGSLPQNASRQDKQYNLAAQSAQGYKKQNAAQSQFLDKRGRTLPWLPAESSAYVHVPGKNRTHSGSSQASTNVSDSEDGVPRKASEDIPWVPGETRCF